MNRILLLLSLLLATSAAIGADARWTSQGPYGADGAIFFHPGDPNVVFSGFYRSTDRGLTWTAFKPALSPEILRFSNKPPYDLIAAEVNGRLTLQKSTDLGSTWSRISDTRLHVYGSSPPGLSDFQISKSNPDVLYTSIVGAGVLRSANGGKSWTVLLRDLPPPQTSFGILQISPTNSNVVFYLYSNSKSAMTVLLKTTNGGQNWASVGPNLDYLRGMTLRIDPQNQNVVYFGTSVSQYKTPDGGKTWKKLLLPPMRDTRNFWVNPRNTAEVWATGSQGFKSMNGGATWTRVTFPRLNHPFMIAIDSKSNLMLASDLDLLRSTDDGKTWNASEPGPRALQIFDLDVNTSRPGRILAAAGPYGIYRSTDSASIWKLLARFNHASISRIRSHPATASTLGAITTAGRFEISRNDGASWKMLDARSFDFAFHAQNEKIIYFVSGKSTDGGATFHDYNLHTDSSGAQQVESDPTKGNTVYVKTLHTIYKSTNAGDTWLNLPIHDPEQLLTLKIAPSNPEFLYVGSNNGIWTSSNGGASWTRYGKESFALLDPVAIDVSNPQVLFATQYGFAIKLSTDGGKSFTDFDRNGLAPGIDVTNGAFDSANPNVLHLGTSAGVFSYTRR